MVEQQMFSISEMAELAGITVRTVRYYISLGLLPPPYERGSTASYGKDHLERLKVIEQLKKRRLSLSEINHMLSTLSLDEIAELINPTIPTDTESVAGVSEFKDMFAASATALRRTKPLRLQGGHLAAASGPPSPTEEDSESWVRERITEGIEIHHKTPLPEDEEAKLFDLVSRARAMFSTASKDTDLLGGPSRFFHRKRNRTE